MYPDNHLGELGSDVPKLQIQVSPSKELAWPVSLKSNFQMLKQSTSFKYPKMLQFTLDTSFKFNVTWLNSSRRASSGIRGCRLLSILLLNPGNTNPCGDSHMLLDFAKDSLQAATTSTGSNVADRYSGQ